MKISFAEATTLNTSRINREEGLRLLKGCDLIELGQMAHALRFKINPKPSVTFVADSNPNYTNICISDCTFCAFYRRESSPEGYRLSIEQVMGKISIAAKRGATTILLQGGHNPKLPFDYYLEMVRQTRLRFPGMTPHFFSASEIRMMADVSGLSLHDVLANLKEAGQYTLPGGGAEILSEKVRKKISPKKQTAAGWLLVHRTAHELGFKSTATMMFGHMEDDEDIIEHLDCIRNLQDETGGFSAFIPWSFKPANTYLEKKISSHAPSNRYLRVLAVSRIYLDNFPHIQASWFSEGKKTGQMALFFGADDFGGTLFEENVHASADYTNEITIDEIKELIREAGFEPLQRTTLYETIEKS